MGGVSGWPAVGAGAPERFIILLVSSRVIGGAMTLVQERKSASVLAASLRVAKYIVTLVVLGTAYFVLPRAGLLLATIHPRETPIWPATGLAIGCMLVFGLRVWPAILLGAFAANAINEITDFTSTNLLLTSSTVALGNTLEALISASLLNLWANRRRGLGECAGHLVHVVARRRRQRFGGNSGGGAVGDREVPAVPVHPICAVVGCARRRLPGWARGLQPADHADCAADLARISRRAAAGLGGAVVRSTRYRDRRSHPGRLCDLGRDRRRRSVRRIDAQRLFFADDRARDLRRDTEPRAQCRYRHAPAGGSAITSA